MAKIVLIGASGDAGSRILQELAARNHSVTAIARNPDRIARLPGVTVVRADVNERAALASALVGHDVVVSAVPFTGSSVDTLVSALRDAGVARYLVVGGAGSLKVAAGQRLLDQPDFPAAYKPEAIAGAAFLDYLKTTNDLDWSFLSPSAEFVPGERTGCFRLGSDELLVTEAGSLISFEDYAIAMVDELEQPKHRRQRFTVGY